jgi:hypothetical protein
MRAVVKVLRCAHGVEDSGVVCRILDFADFGRNLVQQCMILLAWVHNAQGFSSLCVDEELAVVPKRVDLGIRPVDIVEGK